MSDTVEQIAHAAPDLCFRFVAEVERWPDHLDHYAWVRFQEGRGTSESLVEMSAHRPVGPLKWPIWWRAELIRNAEARTVVHRHIAGTTRGMTVRWEIDPLDDERTRMRVHREWERHGRNPVSRFGARFLVDPLVVKGILSRTLEGLKSVAERVGRDDHIKGLMSEEQR